MLSSYRIQKILSSVNSIAEKSYSATKKIRIGIAVIAVILLAGCERINEQDSSVSKTNLTDTAMGTIVSITLYDQKDEDQRSEDQRNKDQRNEDLAESMMEEIRRLENEEFSRRIENSEIGRLNINGRGIVPEDAVPMLELCFNVSRESGGAFDITIGRLTELWKIDEYAQEGSGAVPDVAAIEEALKYCGYEKIVWNNDEMILREGMKLDVGAVAKGSALDRIRISPGIPKDVSGVISLGGSIMTFGTKPDNRPWKIAIVDPVKPDASIGYLEVTGTCFVSTSGDYERYFELAGKKYHHILDPHTGYPAESGLRSVTILSDSGAASDILSTACFVLGWEKGAELADDYQAGIVAVTDNGEVLCNETASEKFHKVLK